MILLCHLLNTVVPWKQLVCDLAIRINVLQNIWWKIIMGVVWRLNCCIDLLARQWEISKHRSLLVEVVTTDMRPTDEQMLGVQRTLLTSERHTMTF